MDGLTLFILIILTASVVYLNNKKSFVLKQDFVRLQIIPHAAGLRADEPDIYLRNLLDTLATSLRYTKMPWGKHYARHSRAFSLSVQYSGRYGTRFYISVPIPLAGVVKNQLLDLSGSLKVKEVSSKEIVSSDLHQFENVTYWRLPIRPATNPNQTALTNDLAVALHGLKPNEQAELRLNLYKKSASSVAKKQLAIFTKTLGLVIKLIFNLMIEITESDPKMRQQRLAKRSLRLQNQQKTKANLIKVSLRTCLKVGSAPRLDALNLATKITLLSSGLKPFIYLNKPTWPWWAKTQNATIEEITQLFSLPASGGLWEEDAILSYSRELPASALDKRRKDIVLGFNDNHVVGLNKKDRQLHTLILGGTGMGKSSMLKYCLIQDMVNKNGAILIDPHGDLANEVIRYVPKNRINDVIYFDPSDLNHPMSINLLELPSDETIDPKELAMYKDFIAESIISIFRKLFSFDDSGGHRIEYILRNTIYTAFSVPGATLPTLNRLLTDDIYRTSVVSNLPDGDLKRFWMSEYAKAGSFQRIKMISGVTAKLGRFERSLAISKIISHPKSSIDFDELLRAKKILICNFAKGTLGEDNSSLLGMLVLAKLELAAMRRIREPYNLRYPCYLYVDEFELFNAKIFTQLISEARKFGVHLMLAEQTLAFQDERDNNIFLANIGNLIAFRSASGTDNRLLAPFFRPYLDETDLSNLAPYSFYLRSSSSSSPRPVSASTIKLAGNGSVNVASKIIKASQKNYSLLKDQVDFVTRDQNLRVPMV